MDQPSGLSADLNAPLSFTRATAELLALVVGGVLVWLSVDAYEAVGGGAAGSLALGIVALPWCVLAAVVTYRVRRGSGRLPWVGLAVGTTFAFLVALFALPELARRRPF